VEDKEMLDLQAVGKMLLLLGGAIFLLGLILTIGGRLPWLGRLPGDIHIEREGFSCSIPIVTSILLSLLLTILLNVVLRLLNRQ
jgi:membrane protein implicated in regulation of membrane protease activity